MNRSILSAFGVSVSVREKTILDEVSFEIESPTVLAILGPNGSGKTTLLKEISGIAPKSGFARSGQIHFRGKGLRGLSSRERAQKVAYVPSELEVAFPIRVQEMVELGSLSTESGGPSLEDCLGSVGLQGEAMRFVHELSGGARQKVLLARAMRQNPRIYLLDETFNKMDLNHQIQMSEWVHQRVKKGSVVIVVTHDYNLASEWADDALLLKNGSVQAFGKIHDVLTQKNLKSLYQQVPIDVIWTPKKKKPKVIFE